MINAALELVQIQLQMLETDEVGAAALVIPPDEGGFSSQLFFIRHLTVELRICCGAGVMLDGAVVNGQETAH